MDEKCAVCGRQRKIHRWIYWGDMHIHHLDSDHGNDEWMNLAYVCAMCHIKLHRHSGYSPEEVWAMSPRLLIRIIQLIELIGWFFLSLRLSVYRYDDALDQDAQPSVNDGMVECELCGELVDRSGMGSHRRWHCPGRAIKSEVVI